MAAEFYTGSDHKGQRARNVGAPAAGTDAAQAAGRSIKTYRSASTPGASQSVTQIALDSTALNDDATYFSSDGAAVTVKKAGLYLVTFWADITCTASFAIFVRLNGTTVQEAGSASSTRISASLVVRLAANDVLTLFMYGNAAITANGTTNSKDVGVGVAMLGL